MLTKNQLSRLVVGMLAVESVGSAAWGQPSFARSASESPRLPTCAAYISDALYTKLSVHGLRCLLVAI